MVHLFETRLALDLSVITGREEAPKSEQRIHEIIEFWRETAGQFCTRQTGNGACYSVLLYSDRYAPVVHSYQWPSWVILADHKSYSPADILSAFRGSAASFSRVDADDWYANDYTSYLEKVIPSIKQDRQFLLHRCYYQYRRDRNETSAEPVAHSSPPFASWVYSDINDRTLALPISPAIGDHSQFKFWPHVGVTGCFAMQTIGGNLANVWQAHSSVPGIPDRFY